MFFWNSRTGQVLDSIISLDGDGSFDLPSRLVCCTVQIALAMLLLESSVLEQNHGKCLQTVKTYSSVTLNYKKALLPT